MNRESTTAQRLGITLLNHASVLIEADGIRLLTDPWYFGYAFDEGWGLRYANDDAMAKAAGATHLWISHFHEDHFHVPTLRVLAETNPGIVFLANRSHNFDMSGRARSLGFRNIVSFSEREPIRLGEAVSAVRYPTTGIDNMLFLKGRGWTLLNFNDCVIPPLSRRLLARKLGTIDIFMCNFNHAGKLLHQGKTEDARVKAALIANFKRNYPPFRPKLVIPFASHHYYRAPESAAQNSSMLTPAELAEVCGDIAPLNVGERLEFSPGSGAYRIDAAASACTPPITQIARPDSVSFDDLRTAAKAYAKKIRSGFGPLARLLPALRVRFCDLDRTMTLKLGREAEAPPGAQPDIECHSSVARSWFAKPYGTDSFAVGAHFRITSGRKTRLVLHLAAGLLVENKLDPKSLLLMLLSRSGAVFLWNRREEILGILLSGKVYADYHKE
jgi:hypothetical protein